MAGVPSAVAGRTRGHTAQVERLVQRGRLRPSAANGGTRRSVSLVFGLREQGWVDAFRTLHGYGEREASWTLPGDRGGWLLDHVLADGLVPVASAYAHDWRRAGLSDHSALVVDFAPG